MITNHISKDAILTVKLRLRTTELYSVDALLDSGSDSSFISRKMLQTLNKAGGLSCGNLSTFPRCFSGVTGNKGVISACFYTGIYLSSDHYAVAILHVIDTDSFDLLLGRDFMIKTKAVLDLSKQTLVTNSCNLKLDDPTSLQAGEKRECSVYVNNRASLPDGTILHVSKMEILPGLTTEECIATSKANCLNIRLMNNNPTTYCLSKDYHVGKAEVMRLDTDNGSSATKSEKPQTTNNSSSPETSGHQTDNDWTEVKVCKQSRFPTTGIPGAELDTAPWGRSVTCASSRGDRPPVELASNDQPVMGVSALPGPQVLWGSSRDADVTTSDKNKLLSVLDNNKDAFVKSDGRIGKCTLQPMKIKLKPDAIAVKRAQYRISPKIVDAVSEQIEDYIEQGIIEPTDSEWNSPVIVLRKGTKRSQKHVAENKEDKVRYRFVCDLRAVNQQIVNDTSIIPNIDDLLDTICLKYEDKSTKPCFFSSLDLKDGYHQMILHEDSRDITAFRWKNKQYRFCRVPQGLNKSGGSFQKVVNQALQDYIDVCAIAYMDDVLIYSPTYEQHLVDIDNVLKAFERVNLKLSPAKCKFARTSAEFLGFLFSEDGYLPNPSHTNAIRTFPRPKTVRDVRCFLGVINFFRKHLQNRAEVAAPLNRLTKKNTVFKWTDECEHSFQTLKQMMTSRPILAYPRFNEDFYLSCDASSKSIGAALTQLDSQGNHQPVAYCGRSLNKHEQNYCVSKLELLAMVYSVQYFRTYLEHRKFYLYTDHSALTQLMTSKTLSPQMARFALILQSFDFEIIHQKGTLNTVADSLSRRRYEEQQTEIDDILEHFHDDQGEGAMNVKPTSEDLPPRICHRLKTIRKQETYALQKNSIVGKEDLTAPLELLFSMSNQDTDNTEEHKSSTNSKDTVQLQVESQQAQTLQTRGSSDGKTKKQRKREIETTDQTAETMQPPNHHQYNLRSGNNDARFPTLDIPIPPLKDKRGKTGDNDLVTDELTLNDIKQAQEEDALYGPIIKYFKQGNLPDNADLAKKILLLAPLYVYNEGALYKKPKLYRNRELRCYKLIIPRSIIHKLLERLHGNANTAHHGIQKTLYNARRIYYWENMDIDIRNYIGNCEHCFLQKHGQKREKPPLTLYEQLDRPFQMVFSDIVGPLPLSKNRYRYICVIVDGFSRYVTAFPMRTKTREECLQGFYDKLICVHGLIDSLHTDRGGETVNKLFQRMCSQFDISHHTNSGYHSASNGRAERCIRSIVELLRTMCNDHNSNWDKLLPHVVFQMNSSINSTTGHSPYFLIHGRVPKTMDMVSGLKIQTDDGHGDDFLSEMLENQQNAYLLTKDYCSRNEAKMKAYYDLHAKPHKINVGSIVYLYRPTKSNETSQKLCRQYVGPYMCDALLEHDKVRLIDIKTRRDYGFPIHVSRLKLASRMKDIVPPDTDAKS